jgi:hypothetical protein
MIQKTTLKGTSMSLQKKTFFLFVIFFLLPATTTLMAHMPLLQRITTLFQNNFSRPCAIMRDNKITSACILIGSSYAATEIISLKYRKKTVFTQPFLHALDIFIVYPLFKWCVAQRPNT